jgi:hypothetical protein
MAERDPKYAGLVAQFDSECGKLFSRLGSIRADRIDVLTRFSRAPARREPSQLNLPALGPFPESVSASDMLDFPVRSLSLPQIADSVWQSRIHNDTQIAKFEAATITGSVAAFVSSSGGDEMRTFKVWRYGDRTAAWVSHLLPIRGTVESIAADAHFAYIMAEDRVFLVPVTREGCPESTAIPSSQGDCVSTPFMEGAVVGFQESSQLLYVTAALAVRCLPTEYRGVVALAQIDGRLLCGALGSTVVRLLAPDGRESRGFVSHVAPITRLARLSDQLFVSAAEDATVRVWDVREKLPIVSVTTTAGSVVSLAGSSDYLVTGLREKAVNVFDLRNTSGRAVLAVTTQEYEPAQLHYNQHEDILAMFGIIASNEARDGMVFNDGESQGLFRVYGKFTEADGR